MNDFDLETLTGSGIPVAHDVPLSGYTTFRLGGPCPVLITCQTPEQLIRAVRYCHKEKIEFILIGGGSNLVVSDKGVACWVIRYLSTAPLITQENYEITVSGSTPLDDLACYAAERGLEGVNCCSGIPGTVGGAVVGNAGAFGRQIGDVVKTVAVMTENGDLRELGRAACGFTYRNSNFKATRDIILSARLALKAGDPRALQSERDGILKLRREKHPDLSADPCAGSFFRNIEPTSKAGQRQAAGWFLEQAGAKKLSVGGAKIFAKHANIIVKSDGCRAQDVYDLSGRMARLVRESFGLELVREVRLVGMFTGMPENVRDTIW